MIGAIGEKCEANEMTHARGGMQLIKVNGSIRVKMLQVAEARRSG
jgi:hypothetical protein